MERDSYGMVVTIMIPEHFFTSVLDINSEQRVFVQSQGEFYRGSNTRHRVAPVSVAGSLLHWY